MTHAEHRAKCIEAMYVALVKNGVLVVPPSVLYPAVTAAFRALHGIAFVDPIEATEEMLAAELDDLDCKPTARDLCIIFDAMAAAGDLTNPPESR